jgi:hypothetical protein
LTDANLNNDPFKTVDEVNYVEEVKKKFANESGELDIAKLARGKYEADKFIERVTAENEELRKKAEQGMALEDFYKKVKGDPAPLGDNGHTVVDPKELSPASPEDIEKIIRDTLSKAENERRVKSNLEVITSKLTEHWGDNAAKELNSIARQLGVSVDDLRDIGLRSPDALFRMIGLNNSPGTPSGTVAPTGGFNIRSDAGGARNQKFYKELRRTNPSLYNDPKTQAQEMRDAIKLGAAFFE